MNEHPLCFGVLHLFHQSFVQFITTITTSVTKTIKIWWIDEDQVSRMTKLEHVVEVTLMDLPILNPKMMLFSEIARELLIVTKWYIELSLAVVPLHTREAQLSHNNICQSTIQWCTSALVQCVTSIIVFFLQVIMLFSLERVDSIQQHMKYCRIFHNLIQIH